MHIRSMTQTQRDPPQLVWFILALIPSFGQPKTSFTFLIDYEAKYRALENITNDVIWVEYLLV